MITLHTYKYTNINLHLLNIMTKCCKLIKLTHERVKDHFIWRVKYVIRQQVFQVLIHKAVLFSNFLYCSFIMYHLIHVGLHPPHPPPPLNQGLLINFHFVVTEQNISAPSANKRTEILIIRKHNMKNLKTKESLSPLSTN